MGVFVKVKCQVRIIELSQSAPGLFCPLDHMVHDWLDPMCDQDIGDLLRNSCIKHLCMQNSAGRMLHDERAIARDQWDRDPQQIGKLAAIPVAPCGCQRHNNASSLCGLDSGYRARSKLSLW